MFTRPKNGWTEIHLEDFEGLGSYIQDIPVMVLDRGVQSVQERTPLKLWFDEEESVFTLTADEETKIVKNGDGQTLLNETKRLPKPQYELKSGTGDEKTPVLLHHSPLRWRMLIVHTRRKWVQCRHLLFQLLR